MKKVIFVLGVFMFLSGLSFAAIQFKNQPAGVDDKGGPSLEAAPLEEAGTLTGEVVRVDQEEGVVEIRTTEGGITRLRLDEKAKEDLKNIKPGDKIAAKLTIEATSIQAEPKG